MADETMAWLPKTARGKSSLALRTHWYPIFVYFFCPTGVPMLWRMCARMHIAAWTETVYELPLLPNNTASETSLHKPGAMRSVDWIFIFGSPAWRRPGECMAVGKTFYNLIFKQEAVTAPSSCQSFFLMCTVVLVCFCLVLRWTAD